MHLTDAALRSRSGGCGDDLHVARIEAGDALVLADQVRAWCGRPDLDVVVKPVVDLDEHIRVDQYEVPDRIAEPVALRDGGCVFPFCGRAARVFEPDEHGADCDHVVPHARGGPTCPCNLAPLCRRHHRLKTTGRWRHHVVEPGSYLWRSPHGYRYLRDHTGTFDVTTETPRTSDRWHGTPPDQ